MKREELFSRLGHWQSCQHCPCWVPLLAAACLASFCCGSNHPQHPCQGPQGRGSRAQSSIKHCSHSVCTRQSTYCRKGKNMTESTYSLANPLWILFPPPQINETEPNWGCSESAQSQGHCPSWAQQSSPGSPCTDADLCKTWPTVYVTHPKSHRDSILLFKAHRNPQINTF